MHSYAVSEIIVLSLYDLYTKAIANGTKDEFAAKFTKLLEAGSGLNPELLKEVFSIDMEDDSFWQMGMNQIKDMQKELESLLIAEGMLPQKN